MKRFLPFVLLAVMFAAGCNTPEDDFMAGKPLSAGPASSATPAAPQTPMPGEAKTNTMTIAPAFALPSDPEPASTMAAAPVAPVVAEKPKAKEAAAPVAATQPIIVTPDNSLAGRVLAYNAPGHFVVLDFPAGPMPGVDQTMFLYRAGLKVAEVKITGPQRDNDTVADVVTGDAQAGDEVRDQ